MRREDLRVPLASVFPLLVVEEHIGGFQPVGKILGCALNGPFECRQRPADVARLATDQCLGGVRVPTRVFLNEPLGHLQGLGKTSRFAQQPNSRHLGQFEQIAGIDPTASDGHVTVQFALLSRGDQPRFWISLQHQQEQFQQGLRRHGFDGPRGLQPIQRPGFQIGGLLIGTYHRHQQVDRLRQFPQTS
jgi:hypothetical protein